MDEYVLLQSILLHQAVWDTWTRRLGVYISIDQTVIRRRWMVPECVTCCAKIIAKPSVIHLQDRQGRTCPSVSGDTFSSVLVCETLSVSFHICSGSTALAAALTHTNNHQDFHYKTYWMLVEGLCSSTKSNLPSVLSSLQPIIISRPDLPD